MKKKKLTKSASKTGRAPKRTKPAPKRTAPRFAVKFAPVSFVSPSKQREFTEACARVVGADHEAFKYTLLGENKPDNIHEQREAALTQLRGLLSLAPDSLLLVRKEGKRYTVVDMSSRQRFATK